jgi:hypothetical protein
MVVQGTPAYGDRDNHQLSLEMNRKENVQRSHNFTTGVLQSRGSTSLLAKPQRNAQNRYEFNYTKRRNILILQDIAIEPKSRRSHISVDITYGSAIILVLTPYSILQSSEVRHRATPLVFTLKKKPFFPQKVRVRK